MTSWAVDTGAHQGLELRRSTCFNHVKGLTLVSERFTLSRGTDFLLLPSQKLHTEYELLIELRKAFSESFTASFRAHSALQKMSTYSKF